DFYCQVWDISRDYSIF
nr:immunoglobulin light chain junction region [Macaca mulatta]